MKNDSKEDAEKKVGSGDSQGDSDYIEFDDPGQDLSVMDPSNQRAQQQAFKDLNSGAQKRKETLSLSTGSEFLNIGNKDLVVIPVKADEASNEQNSGEQVKDITDKQATKNPYQLEPIEGQNLSLNISTNYFQ